MGELNGFPKRLRELRESHHMSRLVLSQLCGLSKNMIAMYERGEKTPSAENLIQLADFFGVSGRLGCTKKILSIPTSGGNYV